MSRREGRDYDTKRRRPSPKRSRWDDKPATDRPSKDINIDLRGRMEQDQKHHHPMRDAPHREGPTASDPKLEARSVSKVSDNTVSSHHKVIKHSFDPTAVPLSRSYFQHDERGNAGQVGRSFSRRAETGKERGWWRNPRDRQSEREAYRTGNDTQKKDEKSPVCREENHTWRHNGYFELVTDPKPPARKRPFKEIKEPVGTENVNEAVVEPVKTSHSDYRVLGSEKMVEIGGQNSRHSGISEKRNREANRGALQRDYVSSRDRYGGSGYSRGRERFADRRDYPQSVARDKEWKHDLFEEANRSPTPKNEEDHIAKIEALLAS